MLITILEIFAGIMLGCGIFILIFPWFLKWTTIYWEWVFGKN
jgi:hypothetical protein